MPSTQSKGGLEVLDRSDASLSELIVHATEILGIDVNKPLDPTQYTSTAPYTFSEQWVLRWLVRRMSSLLDVIHKGKDREAYTQHLLDIRLWRLLLHLCGVISPTLLCETFIDRKSLPVLDGCIRLRLEHFSAPSISAPDVLEQTTNVRSVKRRRLSPPGDVSVESEHDLNVVILQVCARCAQLASPPEDQTDHSQASLWSSVSDCASMFASTLQLCLHSLKERPQDVEASASQLHSILHMWAGRPLAQSDSAKAQEITVFNEGCLSLCLETLDILSDPQLPPMTSRKASIQGLERLLAMTSVLPLRERFIKKHLKNWRSNRPCLTWADVEPVYRDFVVVLGSKPQSREVKATSMVGLDWNGRSHHIYDIATRLLPKYDIRRRQQEQDWLDALLLVLAYIAGPQLPQLELTRIDTVRIIDTAYPAGPTSNIVSIEELLRLSTISQCTPSSHALSYIAATLVSWHELALPSMALSYLLKANENLLLPNTGVPTSTFAMSELVARIGQSSISRQDYKVLRDGVFVKTLTSYAKSRALKDFIDLWRENLQEAMRVRSSPKQDDQDIPALQVWEDDEIFDEFTRLAALSTASSPGEELLTDLQKALAGLSGRVGSTLDVFATLSIASALLRTTGRTRSVSETETLLQIVEQSILALQKRSDYQGQRWRLWNLINSIQRTLPSYQLPADLLNEKVTQASAVLIHPAQGSSAPRRSAHWYQEYLERFKVLADEASKQNEPFVQALDLSLDQLRTSVASLATCRSPEDPRQPLWLGRSLTIHSEEQLLSGCVGMLLARPHLLEAKRQISQDFLRALLRSEGADVSRQETQTPRVEDLLVAAIDTTGAKSTKNLRAILTKSASENSSSLITSPQHHYLVEKILLEGLDAASTRGMADALFEQLKQHNTTPKLPSHLARHLATMDHLSGQYSVSFTGPECWDEWTTIGGNISKQKPWEDAYSFFVICRSLENVIGRLWSRIAANPSKPDLQSQVLADVLVWLRKMKPSKKKARLPTDIPRLYLAQHICCSSEKVIETCVSKDLKELKSQFTNMLVSDIEALAGGSGTTGGVEADPYSRISTILRVVAACPTAWSSSLELHDALQSLLSRVRGARPSFSTVSLYLNDLITDQTRALLAEFGKADTSDPIERRLNELFRLSRPDKFDEHQFGRLAIEADLFAQSLKWEDRAICVELLLQPDVSAGLGVVGPIIVASIVLQISAQETEQDPRLSMSIARVASLASLGEERDLFDVLLALENTKLILATHPSVISQPTIDSLLAQMALLLSGSDTTRISPAVFPEHIFERVCAIVGNLLSRFRRRLADRHHLLLPVLQQLVRCLFYSDEVTKRARQPSVIGSDPSSYLRSLPSWLTLSSVPLPASAAVSLSRLLSSICNPTVSAAKSSSKRSKNNELNDETKRVKTIAGQHMQYLVMEYCRCSLDGDIGPGVKEKLLPGMYTILDAMSRDLMRAMNSAMDPSSRAIFKTLYDDWTRYGKWDKS
ncbi:uncharacterized protein HMPREF1541_08405 [Cyphellophora europaea CBS 101466]|uniref:Nucleolar 27S pre-rRNA processing Urb2/Npa2 C-terminal domain-containing protein n=1 Tax=Cyphellophora europaea (strain CBS 101466) TaxID=1220924 RepID=W2RNX1_CYPE1|nr:uncharacterized protein HMPREF1541_08405 [Cyphellophora europaea CBS 101466]ETN37414.1 hypothetical protein HMPREF1541_08405 [Cyphellophora europaea CBS 101466]